MPKGKCKNREGCEFNDQELGLRFCSRQDICPDYEESSNV